MAAANTTTPSTTPAPNTPGTTTAGTAQTLATNFSVAAHFMWHSRAQTTAEIARIAGIRATLAAHGDGAKPHYATEFGWRTDDVSDAQCAAYMHEAVAIMRTIPGLRAAATYTINAADYPSFGLITAIGAETAIWGRTRRRHGKHQAGPSQRPASAYRRGMPLA